MNRKSLLTVLGVAAVVAAGYLIWTLTHGAAPPPTPTTAAAPVAKKPVKPRPVPAPLAVAPPAAPASEVAAEPAPAIPDPVSFVKSLTDEQNKKFRRLLEEKIADKSRIEAEKYDLSTDLDLSRLDRNPQLALNEAQQQKLSAIKAVFRAKIDAALGDKFAQLDDMDRQIADLQRQSDDARLPTGSYWSAQKPQVQRFNLLGKIQEAKAFFEADYEASVRACLTPAQGQELDRFNLQKAAFNQMAGQFQAAQP